MRKRLFGAGAVFLLLIAVSVAYFFAMRQSTAVVRIAYGAGGPARKRFLEQLAVHGKKHHLNIHLVATEGTDETLNLIDRGGAELGLIAGAIEDQASRKVLEIAPLYMEPLHFLVREPLFEQVSKDFSELRGRTISLDGKATATNVLATELLRFIGLADPMTGKPLYQPVYIPQAQLTTMEDSPSLPDAIFQIGGLPSATVRDLILRLKYRVVALPFGGSFNLDKFRETAAPEPIEKLPLRLNRAFVEEAIIPAFAYSVLPPVPVADRRTVATRLMLIGNPGLDAGVVRRVLELVFSPDISSLTRPPLTVELLDSGFQFERHPGTDAYLDSLKPVDVEGAFTAYARIAEIWGLILTAYFGAAKGLKMWRERRARLPRKSVGDFLNEVLAVEAEALASCTPADRILLDQRLSDIKKASIELHLDDRLENSEEFQSLMVALSDTRSRIWATASDGQTLDRQYN